MNETRFPVHYFLFFLLLCVFYGFNFILLIITINVVCYEKKTLHTYKHTMSVSRHDDDRRDDNAATIAATTATKTATTTAEPSTETTKTAATTAATTETTTASTIVETSAMYCVPFVYLKILKN